MQRLIIGIFFFVIISGISYAGDSYLYILDADKPYHIKIIPLKKPWTIIPESNSICYTRYNKEQCFYAKDGIAWLVGSWVSKEYIFERYEFLWEEK